MGPARDALKGKCMTKTLSFKKSARNLNQFKAKSLMSTLRKDVCNVSSVLVMAFSFPFCRCPFGLEDFAEDGIP